VRRLSRLTAWGNPGYSEGEIEEVEGKNRGNQEGGVVPELRQNSGEKGSQKPNTKFKLLTKARILRRNGIGPSRPSERNKTLTISEDRNRG